MVQPFVPEVISEGEWSLLFFGGAYSHAVLKRAAPGKFMVQAERGGSTRPGEPGEALLEVARRAVACIPGRWLYARVDLIETAAGPWLGELECLEPSLYFAQSADAPARFARALKEIADGSGGLV
jgi:glutathione synthase/RimK-type ligase-like ATP-grasp enzyme